jgi:uncharacterized protein
MLRTFLAPIAMLGLWFAAPAVAAEPLKLLIIDGQNNHNWKAMTPFMKGQLEKAGRFTVDVDTTPEKKFPPEAWNSFRPEFKKYDVILSNYNGEPWPDEVKQALEQYVAAGGGLVIIHAANNAFPEWVEYNKMIGLGWRAPDFGERLTLDDSGRPVRTEKGAGPGAGHGPQHEYSVVIRDLEHPVTRGMPREWLHTRDELYHGQRGPAANMHILATAYSDPAKRGTGAHEPMIWWIPYGKGRVFTTVLGHVTGNDITGIRCIGFLTVMNRGTEWAATGNVTIPIPDNFPTATETSSIPEEK